MNLNNSLPPQQLPFSRKNIKWRKLHLDWAERKTFFNFSLVRNSVMHKKINYDLLNGKLHMSDLVKEINPEDVKADYIPEKIQHYPIINSKLNILRGEESDRVFDYKAIVTNPTAISRKEDEKKALLLNEVQQMLKNESLSDDEFNQQLEKLNYYYSFEWQDMHEMRANFLLRHYDKEQNFKLIFNNGFMDAMAVGEEIYMCDIVGGEPVIERLNPMKVRIFKSGYSNRIEDADIIILEDYWSPGRVIDTYYDVLTPADRKYIENMPDTVGQAGVDSMANIDERLGFVNGNMLDDTMNTNGFYSDSLQFFPDTATSTLLPYDTSGNIRVIRMFWKSRRRIKKVKSYDPKTGDEVFDFYPETYQINKDAGEEEQIFYINEAWEGTKIGAEIYVNMRPRPIQYNRLMNPSRCHFGIIGSIYNLNDSRPFSFVDMMKPYAYQYDVTYDRLKKLIARNWGKLVRLDLSKMPANWEVGKWMYFAKTMGLVVEDSFNEGRSGAAQGKLAGGLNNASTGVVDAELGNSIQQYINILEFIKMEISEAVGITKQREGQISNRETVGGVERATLQSSHITEWLFTIHDDVKKRVLNCFLENAKIAMKGNNTKFQYLLPDGLTKMVDIDGDEFSENDYGIVVDADKGTQELSQKLDGLAQAALQNQKLSFSSIMKLYSSASIMEKQRIVEADERQMQEAAQQAQQQQMQLEQEKTQAEMQMQQSELQGKDNMNVRDNETKLLIAQIQAASSQTDGIQEVEYSPQAKADLEEKIREFNLKLKQDDKKINLDREKMNKEIEIKRIAAKKKSNTK